MDVLVVNSNREQMPWPAVPVGMCTVASAAARAGHDVEVLDLCFSRDPARSVRQALQKRPARVIAISIRNIDNCNFESPHFYLEEIRDAVVRVARAAAPDATIVIGGSAVNVSPGDCFAYLEADLALVGEGEEAFPALLSAIEQRLPLSGVPGLLERGRVSDKRLPILDTGRLGRGEPERGRAVVHDFGITTRSEAWRWVDVRRYGALGGPYPIQSKRGCALKCSYCVYNNIEGHAYRLRDPKEVVDEIEEAVREHGVRQVDFVDSTFNLPLSHARALCDELASRDLGADYSTMGLNPAAVTTELVASMKRAGFKNVMCTPESASATTLETLHKGFKKAAVIRAAEVLRKAQMPTYWFFMLGAPGETLETVQETLSFCAEHVPKTDMVLFSTGIRVYAGTPLERTCKDMHWFAEDDPLFFPSWFVSPELDLKAVYDVLVRAAILHPNWMTNAETVLSPAMAGILKGALRLMGLRGPFWQHLPKLFEWATRVGVRQRGLQEHATEVGKIVHVQHHR
jgi:tRNA A37 methylthiotransferase MiaB